MTGQLNWFWGGLALGLIFLIAVWIVKPIGVSTQFVIFDGVVWNEISADLIEKDPEAKSGYSSTNPYLNKSGGKYAKNVASPINYSFIFVLCIILGAFLSALTKGPDASAKDRIAPKIWRNRFGDASSKRYIVTFLGGILILFGARLAGGCTSGHMMSGMMQTSVSGYLFATAAFAIAVPTAIIIYGRK
ncbi:MAG: YeeE/YedE thiosulfate transporter family protein [Thermodesulfobacteriota bacterium]